MEEVTLALILDECLAAVRKGSTPETAASRYPTLKDELLPLLEVAAMLSEGASQAHEELPPKLRRLKVRLVGSRA